MGADLEAEIGRVAADDLIDGIGREGLLKAAGAVVLERAEQRAVLVFAMPRSERNRMFKTARERSFALKICC
jgi:hypothetical protein